MLLVLGCSRSRDSDALCLLLSELAAVWGALIKGVFVYLLRVIPLLPQFYRCDITDWSVAATFNLPLKIQKPRRTCSDSVGPEPVFWLLSSGLWKRAVFSDSQGVWTKPVTASDSHSICGEALNLHF